MNLVAITQRVEIVSSYKESRDCLDQRWWDFLNQCDLMPLILPNDILLVEKLLKQIEIKGIILTGGNQTVERSEVENYLIKFAIEKQMPLIGVCHGMQMVQKYFNIPLYPVANQVVSQQEIFINEKISIVNSYHDYGTYDNHDNFDVFAKTKDGIVKAIKHKKIPILGIMWHPERNQQFIERDCQLFKEVFNVCDYLEWISWK
ncbi:MAG: hypothetical protein EBQ95_00090 [Gammaproteobacteria bacterium]|nr:hypothetical protein [Gammaproteobacteria bacterium]